MEQPRITVQKTGASYGFMTGIAATIYMILLKVLGLIENVSLHFLLGIILVVGVVLAIKSHSVKKNSLLNYLDGFGIGAVVGLVAAGLFSLVQLIANIFFDNPFIYPYHANDAYGEGGALGLLTVTWLIFGIVIGAFVGYLAMQYFKRPNHKMSED